MAENSNDPLKLAGNIYKLNMENDRVRVFNVTFKPGDKAVMHHHPDHLVYVLKGGKIKIASGGKTDLLELKENQTVFLKAQHHEAENVGNTTLELLVIELKQ
jgi:quercetin dioxygenase-like cupin family protein